MNILLAGLLTAGLTTLGIYLSPRWLETKPRTVEYAVMLVLGLLVGGLVGFKHGLSGTTWQYSLLGAALLTASFVDLKERIIPNEVVLAGLIGAALLQLIAPNGTWLQALFGLLFAFGTLLLLALIYRGGMGFGDVKMSALIGFVLTWRAAGGAYYYPAVVALLVAFILGGVVSLGLLISRRVTRKDAIPFGPFLAVGAIVTMIWGVPLVHWYLGV